jgi:hypothetical protein
MITGSFLLCLIEFTAHWIIDVLKCSGKTNFHQDQLMHYFCKLSYAVVLYLGCKPPF